MWKFLTLLEGALHGRDSPFNNCMNVREVSSVWLRCVCIDYVKTSVSAYNMTQE